ncbi:hypothetical protein TNCV_28091 [Trichonephila clavipes]|uniref:Uncharacterized protein n=1 Tax=Trichonephila clavipes TaxID=2585209 RepID=A0A8X7BNI7_TRICX|nr:hypothetical protein TNCV_28091 [Trichonephila clavipes]
MIRCQELGSFARQQMSARIFRWRLQQYRLSAQRPLLRLLLTLYHRQERLQWCNQQRTGRKNSKTSFFQMNPSSVYNIRVIASVFGSIVVNGHWQRAFVFIILAHHLA